MAENGGLFSGMKFTDLFFPAAGAIASMYNPHIGRGLQTGMNMFNSFQDFQNSARYYKQLKQQQEREQVGIDESRVGFQENIAAIEGDIAGLGLQPGDLRREGPILDESETSKFTLYGEEGPELADPGNFSLHMKELEGIKEEAELAGGPAGQAMSLGMDQIINPKFSDMDLEAMAATDETSGEMRALELLLRQQKFAESQLSAAPTVAAQAGTMAGYRSLDEAYRSEERRKDVLAAIQQQERAAENAEIERQAQVRQVRVLQSVYDESDEAKHARSVSFAERFNMPKDPDAKLSYSQEWQLGSATFSAFQDSEDVGKTKIARDAAAKRALQLALEHKARGLPVPSYMAKQVRDYELATTGQVYPGAPLVTPTASTTPVVQREKPDAISENPSNLAVQTGANWFGSPGVG